LAYEHGDSSSPNTRAAPCSTHSRTKVAKHYCQRLPTTATAPMQPLPPKATPLGVAVAVHVSVAAITEMRCEPRGCPTRPDGRFWRNRPAAAAYGGRGGRHDRHERGGCPEARRTLNGGSPALSAPLGSVRGATPVREDRRNRHEEGIRRRGRHGLGGAGESASTANPGGARRARRGGEGGTARAQRGGWARRRPRVDGTRGRRGRRPQEQAQP